jgi:formate/nitrite transporter FocA (FNT family)
MSWHSFTKITKISCYTLISSIISGILISIGGTLYLSIDNHLIGAFLFSSGLFLIVSVGTPSYIRQVGYLVTNLNVTYFLLVLVTLIGNFLGTDLYCTFLYYNRNDLVQKATALCDSKLLQSPEQTLFYATMCGLLMFIAVDNAKVNKDYLWKAIGVFVCVSSFIICGFEYTVADMFYFGMSATIPDYSMKSLCYIGIVSGGNAIGSFIIPLMLLLRKSLGL